MHRFKTLRDANFDLMKLCEEHDTSYEKGRLEMQQYRCVGVLIMLHFEKCFLWRRGKVPGVAGLYVEHCGLTGNVSSSAR